MEILNTFFSRIITTKRNTQWERQREGEREGELRERERERRKGEWSSKIDFEFTR